MRKPKRASTAQYIRKFERSYLKKLPPTKWNGQKLGRIKGVKIQTVITNQRNSFNFVQNWYDAVQKKCI